MNKITGRQFKSKINQILSYANIKDLIINKFTQIKTQKII